MSLVTSNFDYNPETGVLKNKSGRVLGNLSKSHGYLQFEISRKGYLVHRVAWEIVNGPIPKGMQIDHINHDRTDNRIENLRLVTASQNMKNQSMRSTNSTGVNGVYFRKDTCKYCAQITVDRKVITLGSFSNIDDAAKARVDAERKYGFHKNHGGKIID